MDKLKSIIKEHPFWTTLITWIITYVGIYKLSFWDTENLTQMMIREIIVGGIVLLVIFIATGKEQIKFSLKGLKFGFKLAWWPLLFALLIAMFGSIRLFLGISSIVSNPLIIILECCIFALFVGFYEEGIFRALLFNSFLIKDGDSHKGILRAALYTAILFGALHIFPALVEGELNNGISILTSVGKTAQAALFGFILNAIYIKTESFWTISILHGLNDLFVFIPQYLTKADTLSEVEGITTNSYTASGREGLIIGIGYLIVILIILPVGFSAWRQIKSVKLPNFGLFREKWIPHDAVYVKKLKRN